MDSYDTTQLESIAEIILKNFHGISTDLSNDAISQKINNNSNLELEVSGITCPLLSYNQIGTFDHSGISPNVTVATQGLWFSFVLLNTNNNALNAVKKILANYNEKGSKDDKSPAFSIKLKVTTNAQENTKIAAGTSKVFGLQDIYYKSFSLNGEIITYLLFRHNKFTHQIGMEGGKQVIESMTNNMKRESLF